VHTPTLDEWEATTQFIQPVRDLAGPMAVRTDIMFVTIFSFPSLLTPNSGRLWDGTPVYAAMGPMLPDNVQSSDSGRLWNGIQDNDQSSDQRSLSVIFFLF
jgi:hypothetical protein